MCGIAGILGSTDPVRRTEVQTMLRAMVHRGPDQDGLWQSSDGQTFGHRRLSIIDLSEAGRQPMVDHASGVCLTFNGECYNFQELRKTLAAAGHQFNSNSDTEVILKAYIEWGIEFLPRVRGMFAMAIWDPRRRETYLIRDRLGIKPLYYTSRDQNLVFASELRALLTISNLPRHLNPNAVASYLWHGFVPGAGTIVHGISRLDPGSYLRVHFSGNIIEQRQYWQLPGNRGLTHSRDAPAECRAQLERAVGEHLISDVPLGVFLSGGVDSSVIAALAQRVSASPVTTFNISFDEKRYDESAYARQVAERLGCEHHEIKLTENMFADQLEDALGSLDQPTFDAVNTYFVSRAVRQAGMKVALAGTGGDELFGGYRSFKEIPFSRPVMQLLGRLPSPARRMIAALARTAFHGGVGEVAPQVRWGKFADLMDTRGDVVALYQVFYALFTREFSSTLFRLPHNLEWGLPLSKRQTLNRSIADDADYLTKISRLELASFLGERLLPDTDAASMAVSLEVRVPLLDHAFLESLTMLDDRQRYQPTGSKAFLKSAVADQLDPSIFDRPKAGFELPMERWCRNGLAGEMDSVFRDINLVHSVGLDAESVGRLWRSFKSGAPGLYWSRLWGLYVLITWCRRHGVEVS